MNKRIIEAMTHMLECDSDAFDGDNLFVIPEDDVWATPTQKLWGDSTRVIEGTDEEVHEWAERHVREWRDNYCFHGKAYVVRVLEDGNIHYDTITI